MSYEIVYDKCFIKAKKGQEEVYFPIVSRGSNNCYEYSGKRARSWGVIKSHTNGYLFATKESILSYLGYYNQKLKADNTEYDEKRFGYYTGLTINNRNTSFNQWKNLFKIGCEKALTVEHLREFYIHTNVYIYIYSDEEKARFEQAYPNLSSAYPKTSEELIEVITDFENKIVGYKGASVYVSIDAGENQMKYLRKTLFPRNKTQSERKKRTHYFVVKDMVTGNYVLRLSKYGYKYSGYGLSHCKRFANESQAKQLMKKANEKMFNDRFEVVRINEPIVL